MLTVLIFHEVDDVDHWVKSPKRDEFFGPMGMTHRTFIDPQGTNRVGLVVEVPSMEGLQEALATPEAAEAMKIDGVRPETIVMLVQPLRRSLPHSSRGSRRSDGELRLRVRRRPDRFVHTAGRLVVEDVSVDIGDAICEGGGSFREERLHAFAGVFGPGPARETARLGAVRDYRVGLGEHAVKQLPRHHGRHR